jgi:hypothetical protein
VLVNNAGGIGRDAVLLGQRFKRHSS